MPTYDPSGHESLSAAAQRLTPGQLEAAATLAELRLRRGATTLADTVFAVGTAEYDRAVLAVVYQVNFQVERGVEGEVYTSRSRGGRSESYRDEDVSRDAQSLVDTLISIDEVSAAWPAAGGLR